MVTHKNCILMENIYGIYIVFIGITAFKHSTPASTGIFEPPPKFHPFFLLKCRVNRDLEVLYLHTAHIRR